MNSEALLKTAIKYRVEDVEGALTPGRQLANILVQLENEGVLPNVLLVHLELKGFLALRRHAAGEISYADYLLHAEREQAERRAAAAEEERRAKAEEEQRILEREERIRIACEQYEAEQQALLKRMGKEKPLSPDFYAKYGLNACLCREGHPKLKSILQKIDKGQRMTPGEFAWMSANGDEYHTCFLTPELEVLYHKRESEFLLAEFKRTGDPWQAVNASKHCRKCGEPDQAEKVLCRIDVSRIRGSKLKSALCTTRGGVKRDLRELASAFELGNQAHALTPRNFRPCTLLGAVCYERGDCEQGRAWYVKAVERGFEEDAVDGELRSIFWRLDPKKQAEMRAHLLGMDPVRYNWAATSVKPTRQPASGALPKRLKRDQAERRG